MSRPTPNWHSRLMRFLLGHACERPSNLGIVEGRLAPCPDSPNCVSSFAEDPKHAVDSLKFTLPPQDFFKQLKSVVSEMAGAKIIAEKENYLYAEFTSRIFKFVDDVEFFLEPASRTLHCRSASRIGYSDLGVNRKRIEFIRSKLAHQTTHAADK